MPSELFEDDMADAMHDTARHFEPANLTDLVNGGVRDGRRRRARRRAGVLGGSAALVAVAVTGALVVGPHTGGGAVTGVGAASAGFSRPAASAGPSSPDSVSAAQMVGLLKSVLPPGQVTQTLGRATNDPDVPDAPLAQGVLNGGLVTVLLQKGGFGAGGEACDPTAGTTCTRVRLPGGGTFVFSKGYEYTPPRAGVPDAKSWSGVYTTADGKEQVTIDEWNATAEKGAQPGIANPPLSQAQVQGIATNAVWNRVFAVLPATVVPTGPSGSPSTGPGTGSSGGPSGGGVTDGKDIAGLLNKLLPKGVRHSGTSTQDGFAQELIDAGHGNGLIQINTQQWDIDPKDAGSPSSMIPSEQQIFAGATVLSNGDQLLVDQGSAEKGGNGAVEWTVDLLTPSGFRVVASEFNAPAQGVAATLAEPVLTINQLRALVTDPAWEA